jgi:hypothetical protein
MRSLNDYAVPLGRLTVKTDLDTSDEGVIWDSGEIVGFSYNAAEAVTVAAGVADIFVNAIDSTVNTTFPITAINTGGYVTPSAVLHVTEGDRIFLKSDGGDPTLGILECTAIIRR